MAKTADITEGLAHYSSKLAESFGVKAAIASAITAGVTMVHPGSTGYLIFGFGCLLATDWATGTLKAYIKGDFNMASDSGVRGMVKSLVYLLVLCMSVFISSLSPLLFWLTGFMAVVLILTEFASVIENLYEISRHYGVELPLLEALVVRMRLQVKERLDASNPTPSGDPPQTKKGGTHGD